MNTVIIINLNGNAFHLEEPGFQSLRAYLERAQAQLKDNPDRTEIMADLEQAIADKCAHFLRPHKNVLTAAEIDGVLKEMGPVQTDGDAPGGAASAEQAQGTKSTGAAAPKRLYQIRDGAMLSGVCTGIAAYLDIDVTIVRILFVVLTVLTGGLWILVYLVMMLVVPFANTGEEHAAATGAPFNAQEVIDQAKKHYAEFKDSKEWRRHWRQQRREWRRRWHEGAYWWGHNLQRNVHQFSTSAGYGGHLGATLLIPFLAVFNAVLSLDRRDRLARHHRRDLRVGGIRLDPFVGIHLDPAVCLQRHFAAAAPCASGHLLQHQRPQLSVVRGVVRNPVDRRFDPGLLVRLHPRAAGARLLSALCSTLVDDVEQRRRFIPPHRFPPVDGFLVRRADHRCRGRRIDQCFPGVAGVVSARSGPAPRPRRR
jgi:phage shock protein PspC (stress-responsive transcriptional regulator)